MFRRKPRITDELYGKLMTSFGRAVDLDRFVAGPADALADRAVRDLPNALARVDAAHYAGAARYHLRLLAGSWIIAAEGGVPRETAEVFEEAIVWHFRELGKECAGLPRYLSRLARGEIRVEEPPDGLEGQ